MLQKFLQALDDFEDDPIAPVLGVLILGLCLFALLIAPTPDLAVPQ
jgi:hypothetical protein